MEVYTKDGKVLQYNGKCITPKASGEVWVLNDTIHTDSGAIYEVDFESGGEQWKLLDAGGSDQDTIRYTKQGLSVDVYAGGTWADQAYRTITFDSAPTGELLTWLKTNGTKR
nr:MAG TPA: hypothetical protein [Caudoviricetes sp.]